MSGTDAENHKESANRDRISWKELLMGRPREAFIWLLWGFMGWEFPGIFKGILRFSGNFLGIPKEFRCSGLFWAGLGCYGLFCRIQALPLTAPFNEFLPKLHKTFQTWIGKIKEHQHMDLSLVPSRLPPVT